MRYKDELIKSMKWLGDRENTLFLGQATLFSGHAISGTLTEVPKEKLIELPVMEEVQMGMCAGLVNHIDKMKHMSKGMLIPKVIVRVAVGAKKPIDGGSQHTQDFTESIKNMLTDTEVVELIEPNQIFQTFKDAYNRNGSTVVVEWGDFYVDK